MCIPYKKKCLTLLIGSYNRDWPGGLELPYWKLLCQSSLPPLRSHLEIFVTVTKIKDQDIPEAITVWSISTEMDYLMIVLELQLVQVLDAGLTSELCDRVLEITWSIHWWIQLPDYGTVREDLGFVPGLEWYPWFSWK